MMRFVARSLVRFPQFSHRVPVPVVCSYSLFTLLLLCPGVIFLYLWIWPSPPFSSLPSVRLLPLPRPAAALSLLLSCCYLSRGCVCIPVSPHHIHRLILLVSCRVSSSNSANHHLLPSRILRVIHFLALALYRVDQADLHSIFLLPRPSCHL